MTLFEILKPEGANIGEILAWYHELEHVLTLRREMALASIHKMERAGILTNGMTSWMNGKQIDPADWTQLGIEEKNFPTWKISNDRLDLIEVARSAVRKYINAYKQEIVAIARITKLENQLKKRLHP